MGRGQHVPHGGIGAAWKVPPPLFRVREDETLEDTCVRLATRVEMYSWVVASLARVLKECRDHVPTWVRDDIDVTMKLCDQVKGDRDENAVRADGGSCPAGTDCGSVACEGCGDEHPV